MDNEFTITKCYICGGDEFTILPVEDKITVGKYQVILKKPDRPVCNCCGDYLSSADECVLFEKIRELLKEMV